MSRATPALSANPFHYMISDNPDAFEGRLDELKVISEYLRGDSPRCCAIIGESYIGKTSLLRYLTHPQGARTNEDLDIENLLFVYLDASPYLDAPVPEHISLQFWWDLYHAFQTKLVPTHSSGQSLSRPSMTKNSIDKAYEIKCNIEKLISTQRQRVVFALDNFQGIASLPLSDSAWLRGMATDYKCAYVVTSRYLLHLLYHPGYWDRPSPLWNLFTDRVYLGLLEKEVVMDFILQRGKLTNFWRDEDIAFIKKMAGRHPALLRMACALLYDQRQQTSGMGEREIEEYDVLEYRISRDASPLCNQLWNGLNDPEMMGISRSAEDQKATFTISMHQKVLMDIAHNGDSVEDHQYILGLEERGLIEKVDGKWQLFSGIMHQFVLRQEQVQQLMALAPTYPTVTPMLNETAYLADKNSNPKNAINHASTPTKYPFTYLEGEVYQYLQAHVEEVCDKEEIKQAIWKDGRLPGDSTLQKIIERIRRKIEPDPDNPRYLIAVRGQGYILREGQTEEKRD